MNAMWAWIASFGQLAIWYPPREGVFIIRMNFMVVSLIKN